MAQFMVKPVPAVDTTQVTAVRDRDAHVVDAPAERINQVCHVSITILLQAPREYVVQIAVCLTTTEFPNSGTKAAIEKVIGRRMMVDTQVRTLFQNHNSSPFQTREAGGFPLTPYRLPPHRQGALREDNSEIRI